MSKKIFIWGAMFFLIFAGLVFAQDGKTKIAIIKSLNIKPYNVALDGFKATLSKKGFKNIEFKEFDLGGNGKAANKIKIISQIKNNNFDLILTVGSGSTVFAKNNFKQIPIVFSMVLNPVASGFIKSMKGNPGLNITGASLDIPIETQFKLLQDNVKSLKRIVVFYSPKETEDVVRRAEKVAKQLGFKFKAVPIATQKDIKRSLKDLISKEDALWGLADSTVYSPQTTQFIILETLRNKIPFMGVSSAFVKAGALIAPSCNYADIGRQSAEIALEIINGNNPSVIPISVPQKIELSVNANTAKRINIVLSKDTLNKASNIY
ncbi:MAG: ABC transporter substrate-binding protein [Candidatus Gygaella obscura]|nr:ABC transporter substrate-binding protein [Candidatus Gygaella obscura]